MKDNSSLDKKINHAIWIANSLFNRGKTSGSTANLSFLHHGFIYISGTGSCFGNLERKDFSKLDIKGNHIDGIAPSKEYPLHMMMYNNNSEIGAVIHTHSFYSTIWSIYCKESNNTIPKYTPYLDMKLGAVTLVPYAPPGTEELFKAFKSVLNINRGYLLQNHGPIVGDKDLFSAFFALEELEESARIAWELRNEEVMEL